MSETVKLPELGESVTEGTVTRWLKNVGDTVAVGDALVEVSTDKVDTEVPSPVAGTLQQILVPADSVISVGGDLAVIGEGAPAAAPALAPAAPAPAPAAPVAAAPAAPTPPAAPAAAPAGGASGTDVVLPELGESVAEGTISRWLKNVGDSVAEGDSLLEVSTDKVDTEVPSPVAGTLLEIKVPADSVASVGQVIAVIGDASAVPAPAAPAPVPVATPATPAPAVSAPAPAPVAAPATPATPTPPTPPAPASAATKSYLTPLVRKIAAENNVDINSVAGTGIGGRVRKEDVLAAAEAAKAAAAAPAPAPASAAPATPSAPAAASAAPSPLRGTTEKMTNLRKIVAARMLEAMQTQAQLTTVVEVDVTKLAKLRDANKGAFKAREGANLTFLPFFVKAAVEALKQFPKINASIDTEKGEITYHGSENVGLAVDTPRGLMVPVIKDAGDLSLAGIAKAIGDLAGRTRDNKVKPDELSGGTFTVTNTGSGGALFDTPVVPVGQVAILGTGTITKKPGVITGPDGEDVIAVRQYMYIFLSYDHRLVDGADAARFLAAIKARIENADFGKDVGATK